jgi:hypothetical protein
LNFIHGIRITPSKFDRKCKSFVFTPTTEEQALKERAQEFKVPGSKFNETARLGHVEP